VRCARGSCSVTARLDEAGLIGKNDCLGPVVEVELGRDGAFEVVGGRYHLNNAPEAAADTKPGDIHGQNYISSWWVLSPAGKPITTIPS